MTLFYFVVCLAKYSFILSLSKKTKNYLIKFIIFGILLAIRWVIYPVFRQGYRNLDNKNEFFVRFFPIFCLIYPLKK
ncbi:hypothetical protein COJ46_10520 [Bacillus sp. AFS077874]|nr:hypothetical protein CON00_22825 [Bacillus sp. AFS096315]PFM80636.1 hypothetical protein COJ46_10520 [Bacillus sp. AFS077874]